MNTFATTTLVQHCVMSLAYAIKQERRTGKWCISGVECLPSVIVLIVTVAQCSINEGRLDQVCPWACLGIVLIVIFDVGRHSLSVGPGL